MSDYYQFRDETGTPIDYYQLVNDNNELCKEIERLNNIINKAIEYVKTKNYCSDIFTKDFAIFDKQELLDILKGDDK